MFGTLYRSTYIDLSIVGTHLPPHGGAGSQKSGSLPQIINFAESLEWPRHWSADQATTARPQLQGLRVFRLSGRWCHSARTRRCWWRTCAPVRHAGRVTAALQQHGGCHRCVFRAGHTHLRSHALTRHPIHCTLLVGGEIMVRSYSAARDLWQLRVRRGHETGAWGNRARGSGQRVRPVWSRAGVQSAASEGCSSRAAANACSWQQVARARARWQAHACMRCGHVTDS